jgi:16S rRNA (cytosine1402-N4)-methyltransferase
MIKMTGAAGDNNTPAAVHLPVMLRETLTALRLSPGLTVVDGTVGAGGHSRKILEAIGPTGRLIGLDRDDMMLAHAARNVCGDNVSLVKSSYAELNQVLPTLGLTTVDRILVDLGLSSDQLADRGRGFGFQAGGDLDMRFDTSANRSAAEFLANESRETLQNVFEEFGEEPFAREIASEIVARRNHAPLVTAADLVEAVEAAIPASVRQQSQKHPATRVFQAIRITVNEEFAHLQRAIDDTFPNCLSPGGILVVITFHSLEDRIVKQAFQNKSRWKNLTPNPILPRPNEQKINPRSRSAKIRAAQVA